MASSIIILSSTNNNENVNIGNKSPKNSIMSTQNNITETKTQITKLNSRNGSRVSSASTSISNSIFPNLTPEATHITTQGQLNNFNRPVTSGQIVNILARKTSDLERNSIFSPNENPRLTPPLSLSDPSFTRKNQSPTLENNNKTFVSTQSVNLNNNNNNSTSDTNNASKVKVKYNTENAHQVSNLTVNNLNHFDNLNKVEVKNSDSESPITSFSSPSTSPNESVSQILKNKDGESHLTEAILHEKKEEYDQNRIKSPQTINSASTFSQIGESPIIKSAGLLSGNNSKTKKKVSFNDNLLQVHLIPNLTNFLNVEKCRSFEKSDGMVKIDENYGSNYVDDEPNSPNSFNQFDFSEESKLFLNEPHDYLMIPKPKFSKSHLKQIDSDQTIVNDLKRNIRNHNYNNNHLQVVKLTVHSAKYQNEPKNQQQNFLTLVGSNNFVQKPPPQGAQKRENSSSSSSSNRNFNPQMFTQQRSHTFHSESEGGDSIDDNKTSTSIINFSQSKPPKYMPTGSRSIKFMKSESPKGHPQTPNNSAENYGLVDKTKLKSYENSPKENEIVLNSVKNMQKQPKFIFLKQEENLVKESSFVKQQQPPMEKSNNFNNNSSSSFGSDSNQNMYKTGFEIKNLSNSANKTIGLNSVNQLIALKDVNYYLTSNVKSNLKSLKTPFGYQLGGNEMTKVKVKANSHLNNISNMEPDFRRTHSALPLLRNNTTITPTVTKSNTPPNTGHDTVKIPNSNIPYKVVNSPLMNSLSRAKTFLYNQNSNNMQKRLRGSSIEKTTF